MAAAATSLIVLLWAWGLAGSRTLARSPAGPAYRERHLALSAALGPALATSLLAWAEVLPAWTVGALASTSLLVHMVLDPARSGVWHHRRLRPLALGALATASLVLPSVAPHAALLPALAAAAIFHRHQRGAARLAAEAWSEVRALRERQIAFAAELRLQRVSAPEAPAPTASSRDAA